MVDFNKPIRTANGRKARVLAHSLKGTKYPVVVAVECDDGTEALHQYTEDGKYIIGNSQHLMDLVNELVITTSYVNVFLPQPRLVSTLSYATQERSVLGQSDAPGFVGSLRIVLKGKKLERVDLWEYEEKTNA